MSGRCEDRELEVRRDPTLYAIDGTLVVRPAVLRPVSNTDTKQRMHMRIAGRTNGRADK